MIHNTRPSRQNRSENRDIYTKEYQDGKATIDTFLSLLVFFVIIGIGYCFISNKDAFVFKKSSVKPKVSSKTINNEIKSAEKNNLPKNTSDEKNENRKTLISMPGFSFVYPVDISEISYFTPSKEMRKITSKLIKSKNSVVREYCLPDKTVLLARYFANSSKSFEILRKKADNTLEKLWTVEKRNDCVVYTEQKSGVPSWNNIVNNKDEYLVKLNGGSYYVYKNESLFGEIEKKYSKKHISIRRYSDAEPLYFSFPLFDRNLNRKYKSELLYSFAALLFENVDIDTMIVLFFESLALEEKEKISDAHSESAYPKLGVLLGTGNFKSNTERLFTSKFDKTIGEFIHEFYEFGPDKEKSTKTIRTMTIGNNIRAYVTQEKQCNKVFIAAGNENGFTVSDFHKDYVGSVNYSDKEVSVLDMYIFQMSYLDSDYAVTNPKIKISVKDKSTDEIIGTVTITENNYKDSSLCSIVDHNGDVKGSFKISNNVDGKLKYFAPCFLLLDKAFKKDFIYSLYLESLAFALAHPDM